MPELRQDPITGRWVIFAPTRSARPHDFEPAVAKRIGTVCPFCEGHENLSPAESYALRSADSQANQPGWRVRVVPNKFPALDVGSVVVDPPAGLLGYVVVPGWGIHEVIVESPRHLATTTELSVAELADVLAVYCQRLSSLAALGRVRYGMVFKNVGIAAGASMEHLHSQLVGMPVVPSTVIEELTGAEHYFRRQGECVWCRLINEALAGGGRLVAEVGPFVALCPPAARFAWETWILPRQHASYFHGIEESSLAQLAQITRGVIGSMEQAIPRLAYNYIIHSAPFDTPSPDHYHWHMEIIPRVTSIAGFEWGTGCYINPVLPEEAAETLRRGVAGGGDPTAGSR
jgi:UDPglucose--hexose-1-phosphate uridylyltransferase